MESILQLMTDESFVGKISSGVKTSAISDICPVVKSYNSGYSHNRYYEDDSTWDAEEVRSRDCYSDDTTLNWNYDTSNKGLSPALEDDINGMIHSYKQEFDTIGLQDNPQRKELKLLQGFHQFQSNALKDLSPVEKAYDKSSQLLSKCLFRNNRTRENAENAIQLIEQHSLSNFGHLTHGLVCFPDLLERFLKSQRQNVAVIADEDLAAMVSRCIEHQPTDTYGAESLNHLLQFKEATGLLALEIKLLPGKYQIDNELYTLANSHNIHDSYYDATMECQPFVYTHPDVVIKEQSGKYTGFRDAYHCLLYGDSPHLQALIVRWDLWGDDCTADAARAFFKLADDCPIQAVQANVNKFSARAKHGC